MGDVAQEVAKAFSSKPCIGILADTKTDFKLLDRVVTHVMPVQRYVSGQCNVWSADKYPEEDNRPSEAAVCQPCKDISRLTECDSQATYYL